MQSHTNIRIARNQEPRIPQDISKIHKISIILNIFGANSDKKSIKVMEAEKNNKEKEEQAGIRIKINTKVEQIATN